MGKYDKLWKYVENQEGDELTLTFDEIGTIAGIPLDHSFLNYKKELVPHGWEVGKVSMKQKNRSFSPADGIGFNRPVVRLVNEDAALRMRLPFMSVKKENS